MPLGSRRLWAAGFRRLPGWIPLHERRQPAGDGFGAARDLVSGQHAAHAGTLFEGEVRPAHREVTAPVGRATRGWRRWLDADVSGGDQGDRDSKAAEHDDAGKGVWINQGRTTKSSHSQSAGSVAQSPMPVAALGSLSVTRWPDLSADTGYSGCKKSRHAQPCQGRRVASPMEIQMPCANLCTARPLYTTTKTCGMRRDAVRPAAARRRRQDRESTGSEERRATGRR